MVRRKNFFQRPRRYRLGPRCNATQRWGLVTLQALGSLPLERIVNPSPSSPFLPPSLKDVFWLCHVFPPQYAAYHRPTGDRAKRHGLQNCGPKQTSSKYRLVISDLLAVVESWLSWAPAVDIMVLGCSFTLFFSTYMSEFRKMLVLVTGQCNPSI